MALMGELIVYSAVHVQVFLRFTVRMHWPFALATRDLDYAAVEAGECVPPGFDFAAHARGLLAAEGRKPPAEDADAFADF